MVQFLSAATIAATHHAATGSHGGHLSPVYFALAVVIFLVVWFIFSSGMFFIMHLCGDNNVKEMYRACQKDVVMLTMVITVVFETALSAAAMAGYLPWV